MARRRSTRTPPALALALGMSVLVLVSGPSRSEAAVPHARASAKLANVGGGLPPLEVTLAPAGPGVSVTMAPVGLSVEYPVMARYLGTGTCPPGALAGELLRLGSPPLELAGVSQDMTAPNGAVPPPPSSWETATLYSLPTEFWSQLQCLLGAAKDPLTVGLNVRTGNLSWAKQMVAKAQGAATGGLSFSLGNEPDLYGLPNYSSLDKAFAGEEAVAANTYLQLASYLRQAIGSAPLLGPELSRPARWRHQLPRVLAQLGAQTVGVHLYPLTDCRSPREVTIGGLLSARVADSPARLAWVVAEARAVGSPAIISEANSASCGGLAGVSDRPAAAVWAVRFVLSALKTGFREVRFHSSGDPYDPFVVRGAEVLERPLESALVALNQWLPVGSSFRSLPPVQGLVRTAVEQPGGATVLILDNERARPRPVVLRNAHTVHIAVLSPTRAGLRTETVRAAGHTRLSIAANSVLAISTAR
ncbi:MAG TPA: hypothetical protein VNY35_04440 [Solirubrobacteraceae bacterium]|nr:hypothetical protein [Solirubrobacteraceae bacterium]